MTRAILASALAVTVLIAAASAQTVTRAPARTGPVVAVEPVQITSLQNDLNQLAARVAQLEAGNVQLGERVTELNARLAELEQAYAGHRHAFTDNSVAYSQVTIANQQASHITGLTGAHDLTEPP